MMSSLFNNNLTKWQIGETTSWQNGNLTKWRVDETSEHQNNGLRRKEAKLTIGMDLAIINLFPHLIISTIPTHF